LSDLARAPRGEPSVAIVGLGVIGGSLALALTECGICVRAWSESASDRAAARASGVLVDDAYVADRLAGMDALVLAIPLSAIASVARQLVPLVSGNCVVTHACGLQSASALGLDAALHERLLGTHPMAGSHDSGFRAASASLYHGSAISVETRADERSRRIIETVWRSAGATTVVYRDADAHDRLMTWVSHLPQLTATALAAELASHSVDLAALGPGGRDATRLAASSWAQWRELLEVAPSSLDQALQALETRLATMRDAIRRSRVSDIKSSWESAQRWRRGQGDAP